MQLNQALIAELQVETASTRKMLEKVPTEKNDFKPHDHSMNLGRLSSHVAELPMWIVTTLGADGFDLATMDYKPFIAETPAELVAHMDKSVNAAVEALEKATNEDLQAPWTLRRGDHVMFTLPKVAVIRTFALSHLYHHRGQLSVYLRLLDVHVPGMYGPSYDETALMAANATMDEATAN